MSTERPLKILAIQFRYFGDMVLVTPVLRAIREHYPNCELHLLAPEEVAPLVERLPWLTQFWAVPRQRGRARFRQSWPIVRALRAGRFDRSVDFGGNDRGAILSLLCGARERLAPFFPRGFLGRRFCYTRLVTPASGDTHETLRSLHVLSAWGITSTRSLETEIHPDPALAGFARQLLPEPKIVCHISSSQPKKEWPLAYWAELFRHTNARGQAMVFCAGITPREKSLLDDFKRFVPEAPCLAPEPDLARFLAILKQARLFVSGDTGPLHFAAGLGVPTIALFGASAAGQWAPFGQQHRSLQGGPCRCGGDTAVCLGASPCMATISPEAVLRLVLEDSQQIERLPGAS